MPRCTLPRSLHHWLDKVVFGVDRGVHRGIQGGVTEIHMERPIGALSLGYGGLSKQWSFLWVSYFSMSA